MDPRTNPYAPGAGNPPPELAGRDEVIERAAIALDRIRLERAARSIILIGLRGVGKTVLLNHIRRHAEARGLIVASIETPEDRSLPSLLIPALRVGLLQLSRIEALKAKLEAAGRVLASAAKAFKLKFQDVEFNLDVAPEPGVADSGDFERDLSDLIMAVGLAAKERGTALVLAIDELQHIPETQLSALIAALHRASQEQLPITMIAAGLPQLIGLAGKARSYAERLFEFVQIGQLGERDARLALCKPAEREGIRFSTWSDRRNLAANSWLSVFFAGMGEAHLEYRQGFAHRGDRCDKGHGERAGGARRKFFPSSLRSLDADGKALHAGNGRARTRPSSLRRHRGHA